MFPSSPDGNVALVLCPTWTADKPPVNLAVLAAYLRQNGILARVVDFNVRFYRQIEVRWPAWKALWGTGAWQLWQDYNFFPLLFPGRFPYGLPEHEELEALLRKAATELATSLLEEARARVVGFSVMANTTLLSLMTARELKSREPDTVVIFGGSNCHEGTNEEFFLRSGWVDAVVIGEGEATLVDLCRSLARGGPITPVPGVAVVEEGEIRRGPRRPLIEDLDGLPVPEYGAFEGEPYLFGFEELAIEFSRGCVGRCDFCFDRAYWGRYRCRSGKSGVAQMAELARRHGTRRFFFADLTLNGRPDRVEHLCDAILASGLDVRWGGNARVHPGMDVALLRKMKKAGCQFLHYGFEHVSDDVLGAMRKRCSRADYVEALERAAEAGLAITAGFIVGHPAERDEDFEELLAFVRKYHSRMHQIHAHDMALIRGSPLYDERGARGLIPGRRMPLPEDLAWARSYTYPFDCEWQTSDGTNTRIVRERRVAELRRVLEEIGHSHSFHGQGREGFYEGE